MVSQIRVVVFFVVVVLLMSKSSVSVHVKKITFYFISTFYSDMFIISIQ